MNNFTIVIPVYNALDNLRLLLGMIDQHYPERQLVLVDDCSQLATQEFLYSYSQKPNTEFVQRQRRGWFTRAVNTGLRHVLNKNGSCPEWVICMNSDCTLGAGSFEEFYTLWLAMEAQGHKIGLIAADGPKSHCPRYITVQEPDYATMHCVMFRTKTLIEQNLLFPWKDGQVRGFNGEDLVHIRSDRALSWEFNRRGYLTIISYHAEIGHQGGQSWHHRLGDIPPVNQVGDE